MDTNDNNDKLVAEIIRITYHHDESGSNVVKVKSPKFKNQEITVIFKHPQPIAGCTMEFSGSWKSHPKFGRQFHANSFIEQKPANLAAMEKYIGSGLIKGIGPVLAKKIVKKFGIETLNVFELTPEKLTQISGITSKKLETINEKWNEQRHIREIMIFLQNYGVSTLLCVKIYKEYGNQSIKKINEDPYQLSRDIYGIGFFTADKIALAMGLDLKSKQRIVAGIRHVLDDARSQGHCYLNLDQIQEQAKILLSIDSDFQALDYLNELILEKQICHRQLRVKDEVFDCYYAKSLFFDEQFVGNFFKQRVKEKRNSDRKIVEDTLYELSQKTTTKLSDEQYQSVINMCLEKVSILTGGPGCGKTTTTKALVAVLKKLEKSILLAAPTGRAAQRMKEVIGMDAKTIHRLLIYKPNSGRFQYNEDNPLKGDILIVDECSMLDISLMANLLKAIPEDMQFIMIGDPDQLPSVGAGNVLKDCIQSNKIPTFSLTEVFRQAQGSKIIEYAHGINKGIYPQIDSPLENPKLWNSSIDCMFIDAEEMTNEQAMMIQRLRQFFVQVQKNPELEAYIQKKGKLDQIKNIHEVIYQGADNFELELKKEMSENLEATQLIIPQKYAHIDPIEILQSENEIEELKFILKKIHPFSSLNYGMNATQMLLKIYGESIPKYRGKNLEIQILSPMSRGGLGTTAINQLIQETFNPLHNQNEQIQVGSRIFRVNDRVIQKRNNYDLNVFNGDIGKIIQVQNQEKKLSIYFPGKEDNDGIVEYNQEQMLEIDLAYAITIHKSQGSEFDVVIIPVLTQHFKMLYRNLIYTGLTRAKKLCIFLGTRRALSMAVRNIDARKRQTALSQLIQKKY